MAAAPPPPPPPSVPLPMPFFCNGCLCELKLFDDAPTTGSRVQKRYYTNCQHVLCYSCKLRYNDKCAACKKPCRTMEINNHMSPSYRTYFEPSVKMRTNLIGAVQFQSIQREHITSQMIAEGKRLQGKHQEVEQQLAAVKKDRADALAEKRKISIIFNTISEEVKRVREMQRQRQRLAGGQQQRQAHQIPQQQQPKRRPSNRDAPNWFDDANQGHGHGRGNELGQSNNHAQANHGWMGGFDAATTAQTNFGETPQTYRPFQDATLAVPAHQQPAFPDPFQTMNDRH